MSLSANRPAQGICDAYIRFQSRCRVASRVVGSSIEGEDCGGIFVRGVEDQVA